MSELSIKELEECAAVADRMGDTDLVALIRAKIVALSVPTPTLIDESMAIPEGDHHG